MRNISDEIPRENENILYSKQFFGENYAVYEIKWKNFVEQGQATVDNTAHAHCMLDT
jgi:hypothetical protein